MRKMSLVALLALALVVLSAGVIAAQDKIPLEFGQYVEGELTNSAYEVKYTFSGKAGQVVAVEMLPKPGTYDLDPAVILRDSDGDVLGQNDDWDYPLSLVVAELPADEEYTILATRNGGSTGSTEGAYWIRATLVEPVESGAKLEATIVSDFEKEVPNIFVLRPTETGDVKLGFSQEVSELFAAIDLALWENDSYGGATVMSMDDTAKVSNATFTVSLEAGQIYVLTVKRAFGSYVFDDMQSTVTITIN
ncbi:MAG: hypothetical protein JNJ61_26980 [Anaerolineae bacterium]|nr:hypothetical protein [Anaerolineae bacterium]